MVRIRLRRVGAKKQPVYRVVVADIRSPRGGRFLETLGFYNPRTEPITLVVNEERALHWLRQGAKPTTTTARLLEKLSILQKLQKESP
ncbi:MAG: 30S ribosomal protein S16 [Chloroflexi bacterium]|nr:30S ribosomal protein S16 [Chloroflexota bacterium]